MKLQERLFSLPGLAYRPTVIRRHLQNTPRARAGRSLQRINPVAAAQVEAKLLRHPCLCG